eukprot:5058652-Pyramimonas_sp.AAC.1
MVANAKSAGWRQWVRDHSVDGAAALFAVARPRTPWHSTERFNEGGSSLPVPASPQQEMDILAAEWRR